MEEMIKSKLTFKEETEYETRDDRSYCNNCHGKKVACGRIIVEKPSNLGFFVGGPRCKECFQESLKDLQEIKIKIIHIKLKKETKV